MEERSWASATAPCGVRNLTRGYPLPKWTQQMTPSRQPMLRSGGLQGTAIASPWQSSGHPAERA